MSSSQEVVVAASDCRELSRPPLFLGLCFVLPRETTAMTDWPDSDEPRHSISARVMNMSLVGLKELMAWDLFKWIVVALLTANCLLIAGLYSRIRSDVAELRSDVAELKQGRTTSAQENSGTRTAVGKDIANAKAGLAQAISEMRSGVGEEVAKANAKLDALIESSRKPPSEKPRR
jgi:hypothetical protein